MKRRGDTIAHCCAAFDRPASELATAVLTSAPGCTLYWPAVITCCPGDSPSSTTDRPSNRIRHLDLAQLGLVFRIDRIRIKAVGSVLDPHRRQRQCVLSVLISTRADRMTLHRRDLSLRRCGPARTRGLYGVGRQCGKQGRAAQDQVTNSIDGRSVVDEGLSPGQQVSRRQYKVQPGALVSTAVAISDAGLSRPRNMSDGISAPFIRYPIGNLADDGRHPVRRPRRLSAAAGRALPQVDFPTSRSPPPCPAAAGNHASSVAQPLERQLAQIPASPR